MRKVLLVCAAGMSTSLLMNKMKEYAERINYEVSVEAHPMSHVDDKGPDADVILLGPQVRFNLKKIQEKFPDKPVESIDMVAYGTMNGEKVITRVRELLQDA